MPTWGIASPAVPLPGLTPMLASAISLLETGQRPHDYPSIPETVHTRVVAIFSPPRHELSVEELPAQKKMLPISLLLEMSGKHFLPISEWRELQVH